MNKIEFTEEPDEPTSYIAGDLFLIEGELGILALSLRGKPSYSLVCLHDGQMWVEGIPTQPHNVDFVDATTLAEHLAGYDYEHLGNRVLQVHGYNGDE